MRMPGMDAFPSCRIIVLVLAFLLEAIFVTLVDCVDGISENGGFSASRFPGLNLFALQCNGSNLPSDVRSVQHIALERHSPKADTKPRIIASLSSVDGVRLENNHGNANVYVSGKFDVDNIQATSLTVLLADVVMEAEVTYGCKISYTKRGGSMEMTERLLNVSFSDLQSLYQVQSGDSKNLLQQRLAQTTSSESAEVWGTPMILLMTMAVLLFALFVVCVLLIIDRYRDHYRNRRRMNKFDRKKGGAKDKEAETQPRPLPSPPAWNYPQVIGAPPPRSPYNRLRFGGVGRNLRGVA